MALMESTMMALGTEAPDFTLPNVVDGQDLSLHAYAATSEAQAVLVIFICNHCPYVIHIKDELSRLAKDYLEQGLHVVAISSNDVSRYPADGPEEMAAFARANDFVFPYLYDESQDVARAYDAVCTPDLFLFDGELELAYRGRLDDSRPGNGKPVTGADLRRAIDLLIDGEDIPEAMQVPSAGCSIKWKQPK